MAKSNFAQVKKEHMDNMERIAEDINKIQYIIRIRREMASHYNDPGMELTIQIIESTARTLVYQLSKTSTRLESIKRVVDIEKACESVFVLHNLLQGQMFELGCYFQKKENNTSSEEK